jgi:hypothetical protein
MALAKPIVTACAGLALFAAITSWSPLDGYLAALQRQCPDKRLDRLDAQGLREVLQAVQATLPPRAQAEIDETRAASCSAAHDAMSASCETSAIVGVLAGQGRRDAAVAFICATDGRGTRQ